MLTGFIYVCTGHRRGISSEPGQSEMRERQHTYGGLEAGNAEVHADERGRVQDGGNLTGGLQTDDADLRQAERRESERPLADMEHGSCGNDGAAELDAERHDDRRWGGGKEGVPRRACQGGLQDEDRRVRLQQAP